MTLLGIFTLVHDFLHDSFFKVSLGRRGSGALIASGCEGSVEGADLGGEEVLVMGDCGCGHLAQYLHLVLKGDDRGTSSVGLQESSTCSKKWFRGVPPKPRALCGLGGTVLEGAGTEVGAAVVLKSR